MSEGSIEDDLGTRLPQEEINAKDPIFMEDSSFDVSSSDHSSHENIAFEALHPVAESTQSDVVSHATSAEKLRVRKRTKTGCLSGLIRSFSCLFLQY